MKEFIEAHKINPKETDTKLTMDWDIPIDRKERDTKNLTKIDKEAKEKDFKDKNGTGYKYYKHICLHEEGQSCVLVEI